jgi:protein SCO1
MRLETTGRRGDKPGTCGRPVVTRIYAIIGAVAVLAGLTIGGLLAWSKRPVDPFADCRTASIAGIGRIGGPFTLTDQTGRRVSEADVFTGLSLVYFGYTFCPDVCPLDLARNAEVTDLLAEKDIVLHPVFISVDPARDTPEALAEYAGYYHPALTALTGSDAEIAAVAKAYGVYFARSGEGKGYTVNHSTHSYLMHPDWGFLEFFDRARRPEDMAEAIRCFDGKLRDLTQA